MLLRWSLPRIGLKETQRSTLFLLLRSLILDTVLKKSPKKKSTRQVSSMTTLLDPVKSVSSVCGSTPLKWRRFTLTTCSRMCVTVKFSWRLFIKSTQMSLNGTESKRTRTMNSKRRSTARLLSMLATTREWMWRQLVLVLVTFQMETRRWFWL